MELKVIFIFGFIPSILCQCTQRAAKPEFEKAVFDFSVDLLKRIAQEQDNHFVSSTLSTWTLLTGVSFGAASDTLEEIKEVLNLHKQKCFNKQYLKLVRKITSNTDPGVEIERSSVIFTDGRLVLKNKFVNQFSKLSQNAVKSVPFSNPESAALSINNYVRTATHDTIEEVVNAGDLADVYLILIDALFFKGSWKTQFMKEQTVLSPFYDENGVQTGVVNLMFVNDNFFIKDIDQIKATVVELPYGDSGRYSALIFLPYLNEKLYNVIENLKLITLTTIFKSFEESGKVPVMVQIPRFKISSDLNGMSELLIDMGLTDVFDNKASFPLISDEPLFISELFQKASIEVNEEGAVASVVSAAEFVARSSPESFTANKPFMYMIVDKTHNVPLFAGAYSKPSVY